MMVCYYPSVKKAKMIFSPPQKKKKKKNALKDDSPVEKDDIHPRKYGISS